jgi:predicted lipoprotein with Yx(FWY)xxD motif
MRKLKVGGAAIAAAFALAGCAPAGYNAADYQGTGTNTGGAPAGDGASVPADADPPVELPEDQTTERLTAATVKRMGETVQNEGGFVLYRFDGDNNNPAESTCEGACAKTWPPALTSDGKPELEGIDPKLVGTVTRADGTKQLTLKGWPLYGYLGDQKKAGTWRGQNVDAKWFVVKPDGTKNLTCLPAVSKPVAPPKEDDGAAAGSDDSGNAGGDYSY